MSSSALIELQNVKITFDGRKVLHWLNWKMRTGEHWLIFGPNGSGKTTLLRLIRGYQWPDPGSIGKRIYNLDEEVSESAIGLENKIAWVSSEQQQRYQRNEWDLTGRKIILTGFWDSDLLYEKPTANQINRARQLIKQIKIQTLAGKHYRQMSEGEFRKILIARALVCQPRILILDEFCSGLDLHARHELLSFINRMSRLGTQIIMSAHRKSEVISSITHIAILENGSISRQGPSMEMIKSGFNLKVTPRVKKQVAVRASPEKKKSGLRVLIRNADVYYKEIKILNKIDWQIKPGQNWAVTGLNGSGKSTLIKLIYGDLSCALGGEVSRFDENGLLTILEARPMIGLVSSLLHISYQEDITVERAVVSGFYSSIGLLEQATIRQKQGVQKILEKLNMESIAKTNMQHLSFGQIRKVLIARALVIKPRLLLLDEPMDGLDDSTREELINYFSILSATGTNIIMVSHHDEDIPAIITHRIRLKKGCIVERG
jgi:molybdate transport system ATP-binding protein